MSEDLEALCQSARGRLVPFLHTQHDEADRPVPACPGWSVRDVVAHLLGNVEDALAGRLTGPPTDEQTAEQVARHRADRFTDVVDQWDEQAPAFEKIIGEFKVWPGVIDVVTHEHDIRGALGLPGERDSDGVRATSGALLGWFEPPVAMILETESGAQRVGPEGDPLTLTTTRFEFVRFRMGRRSRRQLENLRWSADPSAVLDHLVVFGPAPADIIE
jgi:uncharacterized protein (TIGR03083 family)